MSLLQLRLSVTRMAGRKKTGVIGAEPIDEAASRAAVFRRDQNTCRFCGFVAAKYQQIHFLNGDRKDWNHANLATACTFCDQCSMLERVNAMRSGKLIWLPEIGQADLHHICRSIYVARISPGPMADAARNALETLLGRGDDVRSRIGTDDPGVLATVLQDYLEEADYKKRAAKLEGVRLMPLDRRIVQEADIEFNQFPQILAYWRSKDGPFGKALPATWEESFKGLASVAA